MNELEHHGVKGMKWGVRKSDRSAKGPTPAVVKKATPGKAVKVTGGQYHPAHPDAISSKLVRQKGRKSTTDSLSNDELQQAIARMNLERQFKDLDRKGSFIGQGKKWVAELLLNEGKQAGARRIRKTFS